MHLCPRVTIISVYDFNSLGMAKKILSELVVWMMSVVMASFQDSLGGILHVNLGRVQGFTRG